MMISGILVYGGTKLNYITYSITIVCQLFLVNYHYYTHIKFQEVDAYIDRLVGYITNFIDFAVDAVCCYTYYQCYSFEINNTS